MTEYAPKKESIGLWPDRNKKGPHDRRLSPPPRDIGRDRHPKASHKARYGSELDKIIKKFKSGGYSKTKA
jgi:hypothetical protein|tara:strand:- start:145 stop:354 length:210 start_codon:yes stop_codon:yes gene_type:complete